MKEGRYQPAGDKPHWNGDLFGVDRVPKLYGPRRKKICLRWFANNTGADQPAHPRSLISALVICFLKSIICKLATGGISIFLLVSVAEETSSKLPFSETPKTGFLATRPTFLLLCWLGCTCWATYMSFRISDKTASLFILQTLTIMVILKGKMLTNSVTYILDFGI